MISRFCEAGEGQATRSNVMLAQEIGWMCNPPFDVHDERVRVIVEQVVQELWKLA
jgi:hypothetical protein